MKCEYKDVNFFNFLTCFSLFDHRQRNKSTWLGVTITIILIHIYSLCYTFIYIKINFYLDLKIFYNYLITVNVWRCYNYLCPPVWCCVFCYLLRALYFWVYVFVRQNILRHWWWSNRPKHVKEIKKVYNFIFTLDNLYYYYCVDIHVYECIAINIKNHISFPLVYHIYSKRTWYLLIDKSFPWTSFSLSCEVGQAVVIRTFTKHVCSCRRESSSRWSLYECKDNKRG